jgi:hypothetical protein
MDLFALVMKTLFSLGGIVFAGVGLMLIWELIKGLAKPE